MKPQALMVGPVFLFAFVAAKDWKMILKKLFVIKELLKVLVSF